MTLDGVKRGERVTVIRILSHEVRMLALRFGITEGAWLECDEVIPSGAILVRRKRQQLAIGRAIAAEIVVETDRRFV